MLVRRTRTSTEPKGVALRQLHLSRPRFVRRELSFPELIWVFQDYSTTGSATRPAVLVGQNLASPLNPKGKHVRFVDTTSDGSPVENVPQDQRTSATDSRQDISNFSRLSKSGSTNLAQILFDQVEKARAGEVGLPTMCAEQCVEASM
jgi:hypothetical protein